MERNSDILSLSTQWG